MIRKNMLWSLLLLVPEISIASQAVVPSSSLSSLVAIATLSAGPIWENAGKRPTFNLATEVEKPISRINQHKNWIVPRDKR